MPQNEPYLIIAQSGRSLAASASRAGIAVHVIDRFADSDTAGLALSCCPVSGTGDRIDIDHLKHLLEGFHGIPISGIVTGAGLEATPDALDDISQYGRLYGNPSEVVTECKDPARFFDLLDRIGVPHPEVRMLPADSGDWLLKKTGGAGGGHIRPYFRGEAVPPDHYLQKRLAGRTLSMVFLADGFNARLVGLNETWTCAFETGDYRYSGAMTLPDTRMGLNSDLEETIRRLVRELSLTGLCGLDLIVEAGNDFSVLEINPRPTATFELHEQENSLFWAHLRACEGELVELPGAVDIHNAQEIIYAGDEFVVPPIAWPAWVKDRPAPGCKINSGEPVCTVQVKASGRTEAKKMLVEHKHKIAALLGIRRQAA